MNENVKPLRWHKFMIYFSLWAGAIRNLVDASKFLNGTIYEDLKPYVYQAFPSMRWIDFAYGLVLISISVYSIYTRFLLAGFVKDAPKKLLSLYAISVVSGLVYILVATMATGISLIQPDNASNILGYLIATVIMFLVNKKYYHNRRELFVN